jgi:hypothetical protein
MDFKTSSILPGNVAPAQDSQTPTGFTFNTLELGSNQFGSYSESLGANSNASPVTDSLLFILDPGNTLLVTGQGTQGNVNGVVGLGWYE